MIQYCSKEHKLQDYSGHRIDCKRLRRMSTSLRKAERKASVLLQELGCDSLEDMGEWRLQPHFQQFEMAQVLLKRSALAAFLCTLHSKKAFDRAYQLIKQTLRIDLEDTLLLRYPMASLMLFLGRNRECYNFINRWNHIEFLKGSWLGGSREPLHRAVQAIRDEECYGHLPSFFLFGPRHESVDRRSLHVSLEFTSCLALIKYRCIFSIAVERLLTEFLTVEMPCDALVKELIASYLFWNDIPVDSRELGADAMRHLFDQFVFFVSPIQSPHAETFWKALFQPTLSLCNIEEAGEADHSRGRDLHSLVHRLMPLWYGSFGAVEMVGLVYRKVLRLDSSLDRELLCAPQPLPF